MKIRQCFFLITFIGVILALQSCRRNSNDVWEDTKSAGRHVQRGVNALIGDYEDSRQIRSREEFEAIDDENFYPDGNFQGYEYPNEGAPDYYPSNAYGAGQNGYGNPDFIPLQDPTNELAINMANSRPPSETPGELGSSIPGIQAFRDPSMHPELAGIFRPIYFEYDSSLVKGQNNLQTIHTCADFLRYHPNMYLFIEGHTDERGPRSYNLALGARRSNAIRDMLINEGVNPDRLFTISYGKERPVILEQHEEGWAKNRRGEFKIYER